MKIILPCLVFLAASLISINNCAAQVFPGDLIITEFMADPVAVTDANGEWIEVFNTSNNSIDINGFYLSDGGADTIQIYSASPLIIPPNGFFIFGQNSDITLNGGVSVNYVFGGYTVNNAGSAVILTDSMFNVIDEISYTATTAGKSTSLDPFYFDATSNDDEDNWCDAINTYGSGDFGTPGSNNPVCGTASVNEHISGVELIYFDNGNQELNISLSSAMQLAVYDATGRNIFNEIISSGKQQLHLPGMKEGVYLYALSSSEKVISGKFSCTR
jgi:hypothetical protein